ncbi:MAG: phosphoadenosine phosphosulfate reductase family protein, partial [Verrucomicrobiota bacterium]
VYPLIDWSDKDVFFYQQAQQLPDHPLWRKGYVSVGDWHSSEPLKPGQAVETTRFGGVKRECGLHASKSAGSEPKS